MYNTEVLLEPEIIHVALLQELAIIVEYVVSEMQGLEEAVLLLVVRLEGVIMYLTHRLQLCHVV